MGNGNGSTSRTAPGDARGGTQSVSTCAAAFADVVSKAYLFFLANYLLQKKTPPRRPPLETICKAFRDALERKPLPPYVKSFCEVARGDDKGCREADDEELRRLALGLRSDIQSLAKEKFQMYLASVNAAPPSARELEGVSRAFADQSAVLTVFFNEQLLDALGASCQGQEGRLEAPPEQIAPDAYRVYDFVGRILFIPVERYVEIIDYDEKFDARKKVFPRCFCAPILHVLRPLVIGREKYLTLNEALKTGMAKAVGDAGPVTTKHCAQLLHGEKIYKHIMSLTLHVLDVYRDEELQETFLEKVNDELRGKSPSVPLEFNQRFCTVLFKCWARFTFDETPDFKNMKKAENILRHHIPEMFKPEEDAWVR